MNCIINISKEEAIKLNVTSAYVAELDGEKVKRKDDFLREISKVFDFPFEVSNYDGFLDFICDLSWISEEEIIIIIYNYSAFLEEDLILKRNLREWFEEDILPFWEEEVIHTVVEGQPRQFNVYLVD